MHSAVPDSIFRTTTLALLPVLYCSDKRSFLCDQMKPKQCCDASRRTPSVGVIVTFTIVMMMLKNPTRLRITGRTPNSTVMKVAKLKQFFDAKAMH